MDLVDEKQSSQSGLTPPARLVEHLLEIGHAGEDRRSLHEMQVGRLREQPRHGGLAGARRPPEHQRTEHARVEHAGERAVGAEQMVLSDHVGQAGWSQFVGERARRVAFEAGGREQARPAAFRAWARLWAHPLNTTDICWPPRKMVMRHTRLGWLVARSRSRVLAI